MRAARKLGIPIATGFHTRFDDYVGRYGAGFLSPWVLAWLRRFHNRGDATLVPTSELAESLAQQGFHHVQHLGRAVDTRQFNAHWRNEELRASWGLKPGELAVIHVGRIAPEKNMPLAVKAFRALQEKRPDAKFIMVGDGPQRTSVQSENPDFIFAGMRRGDDLAQHYASADIFCFPSLSETFGNVTLEAMASGLPVCAFDYGAAREHCKDGVHGRTVGFSDEHAFVKAFVELATHADLKKMGMLANESVQHLHPETVAKAFSRLLHELSDIRSVA